MDIFYPDAVTVNDQEIFKRGALYPLALQIATKLKLHVNSVDVTHGKNHSVSFSGENGFTVATANFHANGGKNNKDKYGVCTTHMPDCSEYTTVCEANNTAYVLRKLAKALAATNDEGSNSEKLIRRALMLGANRLQTDFTNKYPQFNWAEQLQSNNATILTMVEVMLGNRNISDVTATTHNLLANKYKLYTEYLDIKAVKQQQGLDALRGTKYLFCVPRGFSAKTLDRNGVHFSVVEFDEWAGKLQIAQEAAIMKPEELKIIEPLRWYQSFRDIPEQYRDEVLSKLTFARLSREADSGSGGRTDPDGFAPPYYQCKLYPEVNMFTWRRGFSNASYMWFVIDKN